MKEQRNPQVDNTGSEIQKGFLERVTDHENVDIAAIRETGGVQPGNSEGAFVAVKEGCL